MTKFSSFFSSSTAPPSQNGDSPTPPGSAPPAPHSGERVHPSGTKVAEKTRPRGQAAPWPFPPKPPRVDRDAGETTSRRWLAGLAALLLVLAGFGLGLAVASPSASKSRSAFVFGSGKGVQQLTPFAPGGRIKPTAGLLSQRMTLLAELPGARTARARALLVRHGTVANVVFTASVPYSSFSVALTGGIGKGPQRGDSVLALHRRGATFAATSYPVATLTKYVWLTVFQLGTHGAPERPILRISLSALAAKDKVSLSAPSTAGSKPS